MDFAERYGPWGLVVGASQGLGFALASELARRGLNLLITARGKERLEAAAQALRGDFGVEVRTLAADAANPELAASIEEVLDGAELGFLIYNCAAEHHGEFMEVSKEDHLDTIAVNSITPTLLVRSLAPKMLARGHGGVVLCSSLAAKQGTYGWASYSGSKAYTMLLGETLWYEFGLHGVDACAFMIGSTYTPNFVEMQKRKGSIFAETRTPDNLPEGMPVPQTPEEAAANLFARLAEGWEPQVFANPLDKERDDALKQEDRAFAIRRMGDMMRSGYRSQAGSEVGA